MPASPVSVLGTRPLSPKWLVVALLLTAVLFRIIYFVQIADSPLLWMHQWQQTDMNFFASWAQDIAAGDWLTDKPLHPFHGWHEEVAREALNLPQSLRPVSIPPAPGLSPEQALWNHWYGEKTFHQEPAYAYLLAGMFRLFHGIVPAAFVMQMALGLLSLLLLYRLTRRHFGEGAALAALTCGVCCGPMLYYELLLLRPTLIIFFALLFLDCTDRALERGDWYRLLLAGFVGGLWILLKSSFALTVLGVGAVILVRALHNPRRARAGLRAAAGFAAGLVLAVTPLMVRNELVGAPLLSLSSVAPVTFICANAAGYDPTVGWTTSPHLARIMASSDGKLIPAMVATLKTHAGPGSYGQLIWNKFRMIWNWFEIPNNTNYYYFALNAPILKPLLTFYLLAPFALLGLGLAWRKRRSSWPLLLTIGSLVAVMLGFSVLARFRVVLMVLTLPFAGVSIVWLYERIKQRNLRACATALLAGLIILGWTDQPPARDILLIRPQDYTVPFTEITLPLLDQAERSNDWPLVTATLNQALALEPGEIRAISRNNPPHNWAELTLVPFYAQIHQYLGYALGKLGQTSEADLQTRRGNDLNDAMPGNRR